MRLADVDWSTLRGTMLFVFVCVVVSVGVVAASFEFAISKDREFTRENRKLRGIRSRYQSIDEEERLIETFLPRYLALEERGVIGREYRLDWIDTLRSASRDLKLPELRYSISTQSPYDPEFKVAPGGFQVFASEMSLDLGLLHEEDLPALLTRIEQGVRGLHRIASCTISRSGPSFGLDPTEANLRARCVLDWLTVRIPPAEEPT